MDFKEKLSELIILTGKPMTKVAKEMEIPYRTIQDWRNGNSMPPAYVQKLVISYLERYIEDECNE